MLIYAKKRYRVHINLQKPKMEKEVNRPHHFIFLSHSTLPGAAFAVNVSTAIGSYIFTTMSGSYFLSRGADVITSSKSNQKGY